MPTLSKSRFVSGCQCEKKLFFDVFHRELKAEISNQQQAIFNTGHNIGVIAQTVFPGGRDASEAIHGNWQIAIQRTSNWLQSGSITIYEATFSAENGFSAVDILHRNGNELWAIEVKSSSGVKDYHLLDAAFQWHVLNDAGYAPDKLFLMHINSDYVRDGEIIPEQLFHLADITAQVLSLQPFVQTKKEQLLKVLLSEQEVPSIEIGKHCSQPFNCDYKSHCWTHIPSNSVFELYSPHGKDWALYQSGVSALEDIPVDFPLNFRQQLQVEGARSKQTFIDKPAIKDFLSQFKSPCYFLDFETINPTIPVLDGTRPFQKIPFQYSLHITDVDGNIIKHDAFLSDPSSYKSGLSMQDDPRYKLIQQLKRTIDTDGSMVAYNAPFEVSILKQLASDFPDDAAFLNDLINRFVDLIIPFKQAWFYLPEMGGSASIKSVLPAIAPDFSYTNLEINNGGDASQIFANAISEGTLSNWSTLSQSLLAYCNLDTEGMVVIYKHLCALKK